MELLTLHPTESDTGCNSRLSSIASSDTSRSFTDSLAGTTTPCGLRSKCRFVPRANGRPVCSGCGKRRPGYDRLALRRFEFVPLWQIAVVFVYALRRVDCPRCGVVVEHVPWASGKSRLTTTYQGSWPAGPSGSRGRKWPVCFTPPGSMYATRCGTRWPGAWCIAICGGVEAIGVDEIQWRRGHHYLTLVYQIDAGCRRLLWIGRERTEACLRRGLELLGPSFCSGLRFVCSDLWQPYLKVLAEQAGGALHVLDRFHIMKQLGEAIDDVRAAEARRMKQDGYEPVLTHSRWCLLKRPENLTDRQTVKLRELLQYNLRACVLTASRRLPAFLGVSIARLGRKVPRRVVRPSDAVPAGAARRRWPAAYENIVRSYSTGSMPKGRFPPGSLRVSTTKRN